MNSMIERARGALVAALVVLAASGCARGPLATVVTSPGTPEPTAEQRAEDERIRDERRERERAEELKARARAAVPVSPDLAQPSTRQGTEVWRTALKAGGLRVVVGTESRSLWLMRDTLVLFRAPVAVGMEDDFTYGGRRYDFTTPVGRRRVLGKATDPLWVPPDWHYFEVAVEKKLDVVHLRKGQHVMLGDSTRIEVRGDEVGRVNQFGNFWPFTPGSEIIFDGTIYVPPIGSKQRQVPEVLGTHKLEMGDGYLIHGTNQDTSIGDAVSHGCVRMYNEDVARLFEMVPVGTSVYIF